jgi:ribosome-associated heat shock protein Hsp15
MRIDKFLWAVRIYKTRSLAAGKVRDGRVEMDGVKVKAGREVKVGDCISVHRGAWWFSCEVTSLPSSRVGPKLVDDYIINTTPSEEREKEAIAREFMRQQPKRVGRPSKRDRRKLDELND